MKPTEEQITRWIDGELHDYEREEFEAYLKEHPDLLDEKNAAVRAGELLRETLLTEIEPPYADFFNSQIQKAIRKTEMMPATTPAPIRAGFVSSIASWFRSPLGALGAAAAAAIVTFFAVKTSDQPAPVPDTPRNVAVVTSFYTPDDSVSVSSYFSEEAGASVIVVDGLEEIPASYEITGNLAGNVGVDNSVAAGSGWRSLPSDQAVLNWISTSFHGSGIPHRSL